MSTLKLPAASGGGSISLKGPSSLGSDRDLVDTSGNINLLDNQKLNAGTGNDLQIYHDGSHSYIKDSGTGALKILASDFYVNNAADDENIIKGLSNGGVELYYDNSKKLHTDDYGIVLTDSTDSSIQIKLVDDGGTCGYVYGSDDDNIGFLDTSGNWRVRCDDNGYQLYGSNHSDRDLKENITTISGSSLDKLNKLTAKSYNWKQSNDGRIDTSQTYIGFIAQEVQPHFPELVSGTDGKKDMGLDYSGLYAHAIKAVQELSAEVETLKTKVAALEAG